MPDRSQRPQQDETSTLDQRLAWFDTAFGAAALVAAVAALWVAGQGSLGLALLAAGMVSFVVVIRRRMHRAASTLTVVQSALDQAHQRDDESQRQIAVLEGYVARRQADEPYLSLACATSDVLLIAGHDSTLLYVHPEIERHLGFRPEDLLGNDGLGLIHPEDAERARAIFDSVVPPTAPIDVRVRQRPGSWRPVELTVAELPVPARGHSTVVLVRDVAERKASETRLTEQAFQDALTGLPNRTLLLDRFRSALARSARRPDAETALVLIDLDRFKTINDRYGQAVGDDLLVAIARRLATTLRAGDTAARTSGDEFGIVLSDLHSTDEALAIAERIGVELRRPLIAAGREVAIGASIGLAISRPGQHDHVELLREAELALDRALGTGVLAVFDPALGGAKLQRVELEAELRQAVTLGQFEVYYHPAIDLTTGQIATMEALVRWRHPQRGLLEPDDFLAVAESIGLMPTIGTFVLREACQQAAVWREIYGPSAPIVGVNLSPAQIASPVIVTEVASVLREVGLPPESLILEVSGSLTVEDIEEQRSTLMLLREIGVSLAADDAGSGFFTLGNLTRLPVDELKIDRNFIRSLGHDPEDAMIVEAVTNLAHARDMRVVAEGLETEALVVRVRDLGVDLGQGSYFANPLPLADARWLLDQQFALADDDLARVAD